MNKRTIIFTAIIVILIASAGLWFFIGRDKTVSTGEAVRDLLPFGSGDGFDIPGEVSDGGSRYDPDFFNEDGVPVAKFFRISDSPVSGSIAFSRSNQTIARYVERATGHVIEVVLPKAGEETALERKKITNTTMPKIYEAHFRSDGGAVLLRSLRNDGLGQNMGITLTPPTGTSTEALHTISAANFRGDIGSVAVGAGNNLFYALKDSGLVVSSPFDASNINTVFTGTFTEWKVLRGGSNIILQTKAAVGVPGIAYNLNTNGLLSKIIGPLNALSIKPNASGTKIVYSYQEAGELRSLSLDIASGRTMIISPATFAEKCVWGALEDEFVFCANPINTPGFNDPDSWYQGKSTFSDRIWEFDTEQEIARVIIDPKATYGLDIDAIDIKLSPLEDYLLITNKKDYSLWVLRLEE